MAEKDSFIPRIMRAAAAGTGVQVYGDGTQLRDLVHVDDIVAGIFAAWRGGKTGPMILGAGESVSVNDMLAAARSVTGAELPAEHIPAKAGEMPAVIVDISAARAAGYQPTHDLKSARPRCGRSSPSGGSTVARRWTTPRWTRGRRRVRRRVR
jgi:UDP-glucose 4-epimerase